MQKTISHYQSVLLGLSNQDNARTEIDVANSGIEGDIESWIDNEFVTTEIKELWRKSGDELLGLSDDQMPMGTWALACEFMLGSSTLGQLYRKGAHIMSFLPPQSMQIACDSGSEDFEVTVHCYQGERDPHRFLTEFICVTYHRFPCWASNHYIPLKKAWFSYPAPAHAYFYEELFQCPILFDQSTTGFSFDKKHLNQTICRSQAELVDWLRDSPADLLYMPGRDETIGNHVRKQLFMILRDEQRLPSFDRICESLNMSAQVVRRRLAEEDNNYQQIKDSVRCDLISDLLLNSDLSLSEISDKAGFLEVASLSRAFKKWTDTTPADFRKASASN